MVLTAAKIRSLKPKNKRYTVTDSAGLGLETQPSGVKSWRLRFWLNRHRGKINLGRWPEVSLSAARSKRDELMAMIRRGESPNEERRKEKQKLNGITVKEFGLRYLREVVERARKDSAAIRRYLERDVYPALGSIPMAKLEAEHIRQVVFERRDAGRSQAAVAIRNLLKRLCDYAMVCGVISANPAHATPVKFIAKAKARTRVLSEAEIGIFLRAMDAARLRIELKVAFLLILLTMTRKSEMRLARWEHINLERAEWEIPIENSKTAKGQIVYLSRQACELLRSIWPAHRIGYVFANPNSREQPISASTLNRALKRIPLKIQHFTVHDLRRTGSTHLNEMGFDEKWVEKALNHTLRGVRGIYNRAEYAEQRRAMMQTWADRVDSLRGSGGSG